MLMDIGYVTLPESDVLIFVLSLKILCFPTSNHFILLSKGGAVPCWWICHPAWRSLWGRANPTGGDLHETYQELCLTISTWNLSQPSLSIWNLSVTLDLRSIISISDQEWDWSWFQGRLRGPQQSGWFASASVEDDQCHSTKVGKLYIYLVLMF